MHTMVIEPAPAGTDPAAHDAGVRAEIIAACETYGEVELHYPHGTTDVARLVDGELVVTDQSQ